MSNLIPILAFTVIVVRGEITRFVKGLGISPLTYTLHVSTAYPLINDVIVMMSLAWRVGGDVNWLIPNEKEEVVVASSKFEATIET